MRIATYGRSYVWPQGSLLLSQRRFVNATIELTGASNQTIYFPMRLWPFLLKYAS